MRSIKTTGESNSDRTTHRNGSSSDHSFSASVSLTSSYHDNDNGSNGSNVKPMSNSRSISSVSSAIDTGDNNTNNGERNCNNSSSLTSKRPVLVSGSWAQGSVSSSSPMLGMVGTSRPRKEDVEARIYHADVFSPPINTVIVPDIYNKIDAQVQERTRVINAVLDKRLGAQERIICRYRYVAEQAHRKETARVQEELRRIGNKLPSFFAFHKKSDLKEIEDDLRDHPVLYSSSNVRVPQQRHLCLRYFDHHNPLKAARQLAIDLRKEEQRTNIVIRELEENQPNREMNNR